MKNYRIILVCISIAISLSVISGCQNEQKKETQQITPPPSPLNKTIGQLAEVVAYRPIPVKGIGLVVGLANTGSAECPPQARDYLRKYIATQVKDVKRFNPDKMINSKDTAVVLVEGFIPPVAKKQQHFDVSVKAAAETQTTSLKGGRLYTTELKYIGRVENTYSATKNLAYAAGEIYVDTLSNSEGNQRNGFILGGGRTVEENQLMLALFEPDFRNTAVIRNRVNQRFGRNVASASSESIIDLKIPKKYQDDVQRFVELVKSLYITVSAVEENKFANQLLGQLKKEPENIKCQMALEAIGMPTAGKLQELIKSDDTQLRFAAAKCLMNIGDDSALGVLRDTAQDKNSPHRLEAIDTIGKSAYKRDIISIMSRIIGDDDFEVSYRAYKYLKKYDDGAVINMPVADNFDVDRVICNCNKTIYVSRKGTQNIVLFGEPISCDSDIFIESDDKSIIVNALPDENKVSVMRKHPVTGQLAGPLKVSYRLADIIKALGDSPVPKDINKRAGLGISYSDIVALLKKMCQKGAVEAEFIASEPVEL